MSDIEEITDANLVKTEADKVQWLCEVAGCSKEQAGLALTKANGDMCDALDVLPEVMIVPLPHKRVSEEGESSRKRAKSEDPEGGPEVITIDDEGVHSVPSFTSISTISTIDYDEVTALVQMTCCTTPRARAVLEMTGGDVNAAEDIINRQNNRNKQNGQAAPAPVVEVSSDEVVVPVSKDIPGLSIVKEVPIPKELLVLCWNIDGLSEDGLQERLSAVISLIKIRKPHVVMLQEVVHEHVDRLKQSLGVTYEIVWGDRSGGYFNAVLISKKHGHSTARRTIPFPGSMMGRHIVLAQCTMFNKEFTFLTSHFESLKDHARERVSQLHYTCKEMDRCEGFVLFGGDTNLRDADCGILPNTYYDLWELAGRPKDLKYTWDMSINHNLKMRSKAALRFDRMFIRKKPDLKVKSMVSVGKTKLISCDLYPSDHWGILAQLAWD